MSLIRVNIHFLPPLDKTFNFTEPDSLELGRFSGIIQDPAISKKQVRFEIKDGRVYAIAVIQCFFLHLFYLFLSKSCSCFQILYKFFNKSLDRIQ